MSLRGVRPAPIGLAFPGIRAAKLGMFPPALTFPAPGAAVDLDFIARRYWWGGSSKTEGDFTTFALNGSTFDATGLTPSATIDVTLNLAALGTFIPGSHASACFHQAAPASVRIFWQIDDGTVINRIFVSQNTTPRLISQVQQASTPQSVHNIVGTDVLGVRHGLASSFTTDLVMASANGVNGTPDTAAVMPTTANILRIGKSTAANTNPLGSVARVILYTANKTQIQLQELSLAVRDGP